MDAEFRVQTTKRSEMVDITAEVSQAVARSGVMDGKCLVYVPHTTAGVTINEGADPAVAEDILAFLDRQVPWRDSYRHMEGNAAAHIKTSLMGSSVNVIVRAGRPVMGTWQRIFFCEFDGPRTRKVWIHVSS